MHAPTGGRIAGLEGPPREGPAVPQQQPFHREHEIASRTPDAALQIVRCHPLDANLELMSSVRSFHEQRLRFRDLWHLRRRREAFEGGREDPVGFSGASGRPIEFGEAKRRAKNWATRALLFGNRSSGPKGFLGAFGSTRIVLQREPRLGGGAGRTVSNDVRLRPKGGSHRRYRASALSAPGVSASSRASNPL